MPRRADFEEKIRAYRDQRVLRRLDGADQEFILDRAARYRFTYQELKLVCEAALDLRLWNETSLRVWWERTETTLGTERRTAKKRLLTELKSWLGSLRAQAKSYPGSGLPSPPREPLQVVAGTSSKNIVGLCPVASEETLCCNLRTIDAVENCGFGCSYCTIQTFYEGEVVIEARLAEKLRNLELDPKRFYHFGTGQSSDSLMWGNRWGILDALCRFAAEHPNVLVELKTKSGNVAYFLENDVPRNIVLSWSLNAPTIIRNEEHFTARLEDRLLSARRVADRGVGVAFHFHPLVYYQGWREEYGGVVEALLAGFVPEEVAFVSFGTVTFIKPVVKAIRERGRVTKMLQMDLVPGPKGKLSYPDPIKRELFTQIYSAFSPWQGNVFMYLCMEKSDLWRSTFGFVYPGNEAFETDFGRRVLGKLMARNAALSSHCW